MNRNGLVRYIDQTALKPGMNHNYVAKFCRNVEGNHFASARILPNMVETVVETLKNSDTKICTVISPPLGSDWPDVRIREAEDALDKGAQEIGLVVNVSALRSKRYDIITGELDDVVKVSHARGAIVKLIIETSLLTSDQIVKTCGLAEWHGVDIVKTSTGFSAMLSRSISANDVRLAHGSTKPEAGIKAAGGIHTIVDTLVMIKVGATGIGTSAGEEIIGDL